MSSYFNVSLVFALTSAMFSRKKSTCFIAEFFRLIFEGPSDSSIAFPKNPNKSGRSSYLPLVRLGRVIALILTFELYFDAFEAALANFLAGFLGFVLILVAFEGFLLLIVDFLEVLVVVDGGGLI